MASLLSADFGYVLLTATAIGVHCYGQGIAVSRLRKHYGLEYPDMGNGRYSAKLTDEQWYKFNCAQRAHQNYLEGLPMLLSWLLIGGISYPLVAVGFGVTALIGRQFYASGYRNSGPKGRSIGAGVGALCFIGLFGTSVATGLKIAQLI